MTPPESFDLERPDHFTTGAIGEPGQRVFYLQGREGRRVVTLKCEKEQVRALADYLAGLLEKLPEGGRPQGPLDLLEFAEPAWAVASIGVGYDEASDRIVVAARQVVEEEGEEPANARFAITRAQGAAFVDRARKLMQASRPICPLCNLAIDPAGHVCPRRNGHVGANT
jgi:uncharacterized repeat protein (TIGR03847 family)